MPNVVKKSVCFFRSLIISISTPASVIVIPYFNITTLFYNFNKINYINSSAESAAKDEAAGNDDETDKRSVYVGNVDYGATPEELQEHFKSCGAINRITIMVDKFTCCPKGFAYMEFNDEAGVQNATLL